MQVAMIQDELMPLESVHGSYLDRAMYYGDGVYEVIRSYKGRIFALEDHLTRFANSLRAVDIHGLSIDAVRQRGAAPHVSLIGLQRHVARHGQVRDRTAFGRNCTMAHTGQQDPGQDSPFHSHRPFDLWRLWRHF